MPCSLAVSLQEEKGPYRLAFTLVELLTTIGIIAFLVALLLPTLVAARTQARAVTCLSNIRALGTGLILFAQGNNWKYPANTTSPAPEKSWHDLDSVGRFIPMSSSNGNCVYACPEDPQGQLSYSMNIWMSGAVDKAVLQPKAPAVVNGQLWPRRRKSAAIILLAESWSYTQGSWAYSQQPPVTLPTWGYLAQSTIGNKSRVAVKQFGSLGGISPFYANRWGTINCELAYMRHRAEHGPGTGTRPLGRVTICFEDGHAALCSNADLVDPLGQSTGLAAWSPLDFVRY
jgi:type II secretory pathway pseudopilin PulG